jgi:hypothetical protein
MMRNQGEMAKGQRDLLHKHILSRLKVLGSVKASG